MVKVETLQEESVESTDQNGISILDYLIAILGFGLCRAWIVYCLVAPLADRHFASFNWLYLIVGATTCLFVFFVVKRLREDSGLFRRSLYIACCASLAASAVFFPLAIAINTEMLLIVSFFIGGIGAGLLQVLWGERFAAFEIRFVTIVSPSAAIVTTFIVAAAMVETSLLGYVLFPILSFFLLILFAERTGIKLKSLFSRESASPAEEKRQLVLKNLIKAPLLSHRIDKQAPQHTAPPLAYSSLSVEIKKLLFSIMMFSFLCRVFDMVLPAENDPFDAFGGSALVAVLIVGAAFLLIVTIFKGRFNPSLTYRLSLPIMVAGFVYVALFFDAHVALPMLLINIGYELFDLLVWILFTDIARRDGERPLRIFGIGVSFIYFGMALAYLVGELLLILMESGDIQLAVIALLSVLSLVTVGFLVIPEGTIEQLIHAMRSNKKSPDSKEEAEEKTEGVREGRIESCCAQIAQEQGLTPRESEVLILLAYGRTLTIIARDLQIAQGTARTHIENIYRKLAVHKQQQLIDLVHGYELNKDGFESSTGSPKKPPSIAP